MKLHKILFTAFLACAAIARAEEANSPSPASTSTAEVPVPAGAAVPPPVVPTESLDDVIEKALKAMVSKTAAAKGRVAIMDFPALGSGKLTELSSYISNKAGNRFIEAGRQVVDRGALEKIISEQKLQQNSLMDAATAAKVGKLAGAGVFIVGNYSILTKKFVMTVRALSVETGQFVAASEQTIPLNDELRAEVDELHKKSLAIVNGSNLEAAPDNALPSVGDGSVDDKRATFNKQVCREIKSDLSMYAILKMAYDVGYIDESFFSKGNEGGSFHIDASGERLHGFSLGDWWFAASQSDTLYPSTFGAAIKGRVSKDVKIKGWLYSGPDGDFKACITKQDWWQLMRPSAKSAAGKKK